MYHYEVRFLKTASEKKAWDTALLHCPENILYAQSWYLDAVAPRWAAAVERKNKQITALMPLPFRKKYGQWIVWQPLFCQQLGFFFTPSASTQAAVKLLQLVQKHFPYAPKLSGNIDNALTAPFAIDNLTVKKKATHHLTLSKSYREAIENLNTNRKRNLKKALRTPSEIVMSRDPLPMLRFFRESAAKKIPGGVKENAYSTFLKLFEAVEARGLGELYYAKREGELHAGAWFVSFNGKLVYLFNSTSPKHHRENGPTQILNYIFKKYQNTNLILDFESPEDKNVAYFYESFGAEEVIYPSYTWNKLPAWQRKLHSLVKAVKKRKA